MGCLGLLFWIFSWARRRNQLFDDSTMAEFCRHYLFPLNAIYTKKVLLLLDNDTY
jgi:hypothetical protein